MFARSAASVLRVVRSCKRVALLGVLLSAPAVAGPGLCVVSVSPTNGAIGASAAAPVVVTFNATLNPATVNASTVRVFGRWSGVVPGTTSLDVGGTQLKFTPARPYFAGELVTVMLSSGIQSGAGAALAGGFTSSFWARAATASKVFTLTDVISFRLPGEGLVRTYGFNAIDIDGDGSPDMSATNEVSNDVRVLRNDGCGNYGPMVIHAMPGGSEPSPNDSADFNGDGRADLVTGNQSSVNIAVFFNNGNGGFGTPTMYPAIASSHGVAVLDADADGDVDVLAATTGDMMMFTNNGAGGFAHTSTIDGGGSGEWQVAVADLNNDGFGDASVANLFSGSVGLLLGNGAGGLTLSDVKNTSGNPWAMALGDIDNDGRIDAVASNGNQGQAVVLRGNGAGQFFAPVFYSTGSATVATDLGDLDGDGDLDLTASNFGSGDVKMFTNQGGIFMNPVSLPTTSASSCSVMVDYDRDGDLDVICTDELDDKAFVYTNSGPNKPGVQAPRCEAALRVNSQAVRGGYGAPTNPLPSGAQAFLNVSGAPLATYALLAGPVAQPGVSSPAGLLNLGAPLATILVFVTNAFGESVLAVPVPGSLPIGTSAALQAAVADPTSPVGFRLSNPEAITIVP